MSEGQPQRRAIPLWESDSPKSLSAEILLDRSPFRLRVVLSELLRTLSGRASQKNLDLVCEISPGVPDELIGNSARLRQVLHNLIGNAIQFTEQGQVVFGVAVQQRSADTARLRFSVEDSGEGIPAEVVQGLTSVLAVPSRPGCDVGLGLLISASLVRLMDGRMWVDSAPGEGTTVSFTLDLGLVRHAWDPAGLRDRPAPAVLPSDTARQHEQD